MSTIDERQARAAAAESAVAQRHLRRVLACPGTTLGVASYPATRWHRCFGAWHYWWQAHLLDCLIDAQLRDRSPARLSQIRRVIRSVRLRNATGWANRYYDDGAWLALALQRAERLLGIARTHAQDVLCARLESAWNPRRVTASGVVIDVGGMPWRVRSDFRNTPANGPTAVFLARRGHIEQAQTITDWMYEVLLDPERGLIIDGIEVNGVRHRACYTYCQGVVIGASLELYRVGGQANELARLAALVNAVSQQLCDADGVIVGGGGGDGGLFNAILARYLCHTAMTLPGSDPIAGQVRDQARRIVLASAEACWQQRQELSSGPVLSPDWTRRAQLPPNDRHSRAVARTSNGATMGSVVPERDLSVQAGGWMVLELAARLARTTSSSPCAPPIL